MNSINSKHPDYNNELLDPEKDVFRPEFKRDTRGRYFMQLPGYGKWMVGNEPGSKIIAQGSEDEAGGPALDVGSIRTGSLHSETVITIGENVFIDGSGFITLGKYKEEVGASLLLSKEGMFGYSNKDLIFGFFLEKNKTFEVGDVFIGDYASDSYVLWDDSEGELIIKGNVSATSGTIGGWEIGACLKEEYTYTDDSKTKIELCAGNPGHIQVAYSPSGSFSLPGDVYMVQMTQGSTADAGGVPIPRMDVYRNGVKRMMLNSDGLYFFESDGSTIATSILSGATNEENFSNVEITGGNISDQSVDRVGHSANNVADIVPASLTVSDTGTIIADDGAISSYITLTWNVISTNTFDHYLIRYKQNSYAHYNYIETKTNTITIDGFVPNISIDFSIASVNKYGITSSYSSTVNSTTATDSIAPNTPTGLTAIGGFKKVVLTWNANTEYDLSEYYIYRHTSNSSGSASRVGISDSSQYIDDLSTVSYSDGESVSTYYYWIKAIDTSRNDSNFSSVASDKSKLIDDDSVYYIGAAKILIDGTTYFSSWRHNSELTKIDGGEIYVGSFIDIESNGHIKSGQSAYNTGTGWWLGDVSGTPCLSIGNSGGSKLTWNGSTLDVTGVIKATSGYIGGSAAGWKIASNVLQAYSGATKLIELSSSGPHIQCLKDSNNYVQMTPASSDPRFDVFVSGYRRIRLNSSGLTFFTTGGAETHKIGLGSSDGDVTFAGGLIRLFDKGIRISHDGGACALNLQDEGSTYLRMYVDTSARSYHGTIDLPNSDVLTIRDNSGPPGNKLVDFTGRSAYGNVGIADFYQPIGLYIGGTVSGSRPVPTGAGNGWMFYNESYNEIWAYISGSWQALDSGGGSSGTVTSIATSGAITGGTITTTGTISHSTSSGYKHLPSSGSAYQVLRNSSSGTAVWDSRVYIGGNSSYYIYRDGYSPYDTIFEGPNGTDFAFKRGTTIYAKIDDNFWTKGNLLADGQLSVGGTMTNTSGDIICNTGNLQLKKNGALIAIDDTGGTTHYLSVKYNATVGQYILST